MKNGLAMVMMIAATPCKSADNSVLFLTSGFCLSSVTGSWKFSGVSSEPNTPGHTEDKYILLNNIQRVDNGIELIIDNIGNVYLLNSYGDFYQYNTATNVFNFYLATPIADGSTILP